MNDKVLLLVMLLQLVVYTMAMPAAAMALPMVTVNENQASIRYVQYITKYRIHSRCDCENPINREYNNERVESEHNFKKIEWSKFGCWIHVRNDQREKERSDRFLIRFTYCFQCKRWIDWKCEQQLNVWYSIRRDKTWHHIHNIYNTRGFKSRQCETVRGGGGDGGVATKRLQHIRNGIKQWPKQFVDTMRAIERGNSNPKREHHCTAHRCRALRFTKWFVLVNGFIIYWFIL